MAGQDVRFGNVKFTVKAEDDLILEGRERSVVRVPANSTYSCLMLKSQKFSSLFRHYSKNHGLDKESLVFYFTNEIKPDDTPDSIHLQNVIPNIKLLRLKLVLTIIYKEDIIIVEERKKKRELLVTNSQRSQDKEYFGSMKKLLEDGDDYDVTFVVGPKHIPVLAHRIILTARSEFFRAMFRKGSLRESCEGTVRVEEDNVETFKRVLEFIYTNRVDGLRLCNADELIAIIKLSEQYLLRSLKGYCETVGVSIINSKNVARLLSASEKYSASVLREACFDYTLSNIDELTESSTFVEQLDEDPHLAISLLKVAAGIKRGHPCKKRRLEDQNGI